MLMFFEAQEAGCSNKKVMKALHEKICAFSIIIIIFPKTQSTLLINDIYIYIYVDKK